MSKEWHERSKLQKSRLEEGRRGRHLLPGLLGNRRLIRAALRNHTAIGQVFIVLQLFQFDSVAEAPRLLAQAPWHYVRFAATRRALICCFERSHQDRPIDPSFWGLGGHVHYLPQCYRQKPDVTEVVPPPPDHAC